MALRPSRSAGGKGAWGAMHATDKKPALMGLVLTALLGVLTLWATLHS